MELRIYDAELNKIGIIEEYKSLLWDRKYYEPGCFTLKLPLTSRNIDYIKRGRIIGKTDAVEAGVIEYIQMTDEPGSKIMEVKGRFLSSYLDRRVLVGRHNYTGTSEVIMRTCIGDAASIPLLQLGELQGFTDTMKKQATYKNLLDVEQSISKQSGHGFRVRPDFVNKVLYFEVYDGLDRSKAQTDRSRAIFNETYGNLNKICSTETDSLYKTVAYVGGEGEGDERVYVTIGDTSATGLDLREVFIDAKNIRKEEGMTDEEYRQLLENEGYSKLAKEYILSKAIDSTVNPMLNFIYKRDYDLGDTVTIEKESWGIVMNLQITEIMEQYIGGGLTVTPTFGDPIPTITWRDDDE